MLLTNLYKLYSLIKSGDEETAKEYLKILPHDEKLALRFDSPNLVNLACWLASFKTDKMYDQSPIGENTHYHEYSTDDAKKFFDHAKKIIQDIHDNWNAANIIDNRDDIFWLTLDKDQEGHLHGLEDSLQWTTYFIKALYSLRDKYDQDFQTTIDDLMLRSLKGVRECMYNDNGIRCIRRHPIKSIHYDLEPISVDMISGIIPLLDMEGDSTIPSDVENAVRDVLYNWHYTIFDNDFIIPGATSDISSHDLKPNVLWNYGKMLSYIGSKVINKVITSDDLTYMEAMLKIKPFNTELPWKRGGLWGTITSMNLANQLIKKTPEVKMQLIDFMDQNYKIYGYSGNAEFASLLCQGYQSIAYKTKMEEFAYRTLKEIEPFMTMEFPVNGSQSNYGTIPCGKVGSQAPYPVNCRPRTDYMWQRNGYTLHSSGPFSSSDRNGWQHPSLDFLVPFARVSDVVYYPK